MSEARRAALPSSAVPILERRGLASGNPRLVQLLRRGMRVLDIGCGTGSITAEIAAAVGPEGSVVGLDRDAALIQAARERRRAANLTFEVGDARGHRYDARFDLVTAARVLQWVAEPGTALLSMVSAARPGGVVEVLDYDHELVRWEPEPPPSVRRFYAAFLAWRADAGMDNRIASRLAELFRDAGLVEVVATPQPEVVRRGDDEFAAAIGLWGDVAASRGHQIVRDGFLGEAERAAAESDHRAWARDAAQLQALHLVAVEGRRPA